MKNSVKELLKNNQKGRGEGALSRLKRIFQGRQAKRIQKSSGSSNSKRGDIGLGERIKSFVLRFALLLTLIFVGVQIFNLIRTLGQFEIKNVASENSTDTSNNVVSNTLFVLEKPGKKDQISHVFLITYNRDNGKSMVIHMPDWLYYKPTDDLNIPPVNLATSLYVGEGFAQPGVNRYDFLIEQISDTVAVEIDSYVWIHSNIAATFQKTFLKDNPTSENMVKFLEGYSVGQGLYAILANEPLRTGIYSNYSAASLALKLDELKKHINTRETVQIDISSMRSQLVVKERLASGTEVDLLDRGAFDETIKKSVIILTPKAIEDEQAKVEVFNGSGVQGAATKIGRYIRNAGTELIRIENLQQPSNESLIYVRNRALYGDSLNKIEEIVQRSYNLSATIDGEPPFLSSGDIVVVLGKVKDE